MVVEAAYQGKTASPGFAEHGPIRVAFSADGAPTTAHAPRICLSSDRSLSSGSCSGLTWDDQPMVAIAGTAPPTAIVAFEHTGLFKVDGQYRVVGHVSATSFPDV